MKSKLFTVVVACLAGCLISCNDDEFLRENPETSFTYINAFTISSQVGDCLADVYYTHKQYVFNYNGDNAPQIHGNDVLECRFAAGLSYNYSIMSNWHTNTAQTPWNTWYNIVAKANLTLYGAEQVTWANGNDKEQVIAQARFLRGYSYLNLGELWGGVPISDEFSETPRTDWVRSSRKDTYLFAIADLEAAAAVLPEHQQPGRVGKGAAYHFLAEAYLALAADQNNDPTSLDKAIAAADETLRRHQLMTERFGSRANPNSTGSYQDIPDYYPDGDVYFDLFQRGNLDYEEGNTESLWVEQANFSFYQKYASSANSVVALNIPRMYGPQASNLAWRSEYVEEGAGMGPFNGGGVVNDRYGIPGSFSAFTGGRSVGYNRPTRFAMYGVWENCGGDIRNSPVNIRREFKVRDPNHSLYHVEGFVISPDNVREYCTEGSIHDWHPVFSKTNPVDDWGYEGLESGVDNRTYVFHDFYYVRAAETYLLRAEAKLLKGDKAGAAADINTVRSRAKAPLITANDVTIDYILDERIRELYGEERRWQTLLRMGGDIPRNRIVKYGMHMADYPENKSGEPWTNFLWPVPQSTIDSNIDALLEQNPGWK